jgi:hypothetical protein
MTLETSRVCAEADCEGAKKSAGSKRPERNSFFIRFSFRAARRANEIQAAEEDNNVSTLKVQARSSFDE